MAAASGTLVGAENRRSLGGKFALAKELNIR